MKLKRRAIVTIAVIVALVASVTFAVSPYVIARGILGKTPFDSPSFSIQNLQLSRNGTLCYIKSTVQDTGNIWINLLTLKLNGTFVWWDAWTAPGQADVNNQVFMNYGRFQCANVLPGQTYVALYLSHFADGVDQNATTIVRVANYPLYWDSPERFSAEA